MPRAQTKAERRQARADHRRTAARAPAPAPAEVEAPATEDAAGEIEGRLEQLEQALAEGAERAEALLRRVDLIGEAIQEAQPAPGRTDGPMDATTEGIQNGMRFRSESAVAVDQPLALICQAQRSGGTLLARLFDGHPQCHAHPHELHIGDKRPHVWPEIELDEDPEAWFEKLQEEKLGQLFNKGKAHVPLKAQNPKGGEGHYPFILPPAFQRALFLDEVERRGPIGSEREVLNAYMTSLFNAWLDNDNLRGPEKRWVVAFSPRRAWGDGLHKHFELYPDGRLISVLRDPLSWYSSAQERDPKADPEGLLDHWLRSSSEMLEAHRRYADRFCIVRFDELVLETDAAMRRLADFLGIDFDPCLTVPTFNGYTVGANSSFEVRETGVVTDPVERYKEVLSPAQRKLVRKRCEERYNEILPLAEGGTPATAPDRLSLATATVAQLGSIEGVGRAAARQIIEFRDERDGVASIEQLDQISGIGPRTMTVLRARLDP